MSVSIPVMIQSSLQLIQLLADIGISIQQAQSGQEITDEEWASLKDRLQEANDKWESA